ncbi:hypothetical protein FLK61_41390 [Paenalkalicoccus suaedae]|uniref:Uncharacterized protein n=1 Tax=Paenalkalicoccus suaedae TaxID=2592382 RepID=A0A859FJS3_9BACI|nr:hypothetical protein [Paenalkalicoccus suaedae]QKS73048.1 hypothetical protein FLK61_41390 [Paenalkalicoccus suaedae]
MNSLIDYLVNFAPLIAIFYALTLAIFPRIFALHKLEYYSGVSLLFFWLSAALALISLIAASFIAGTIILLTTSVTLLIIPSTIIFIIINLVVINYLAEDKATLFELMRNASL